MSFQRCDVILLVLAITGSVMCQGPKDCTQADQCSCTMTDGSGTVDITSLGNKDNSPRFKDVKNDEEGYYYSYNPCGGFNEDDCTNAAACVLDQDKQQSQQIGDSDRIAFKYDDDNNGVVVAYTSGTGVLRLTTVNLVCEESACEPSFQPLGEQGAGQFEMTLKTICACPGMCTSSGPKSCSSSSGGLSGGSILLIGFFSILFLYIIAGVLFMKFKQKATGSDLIPNKTLWVSLPGHVKNGFKFTVAKVLRKGDPVYDTI